MDRSVWKFGIATALVWGALAFGAAPARAQVYVTGNTAPVQGHGAPAQPQAYVTGYYAPALSYSYYCRPTYYVTSYPAYVATPVYTSYYYVPTCRYHYPRCGYVTRCGYSSYVSRGWRGRCCW
jgi:hypothetical protein